MAVSPPVPVNGIKGESLALDGGGWLIGLPNISDVSTNVTLSDENTKFPIHTELKIKPNTCPFVLVDYPLHSMGINGQIKYSTVELVSSKKTDDLVELTFAFNDSAELMVNWPNSSLVDAGGWHIEEVQAGFRLWLHSKVFVSAEILGFNGKRVVIKAMNREEVCNEEFKRQSNMLFETNTVESQQIDLTRTHWRSVKMDPSNEDWFTSALSCKSDRLYLEQNNIYRGFGWYRSSISNIKDLRGFLIRSGSDILTIHFDNNYLGTFVPGGGDQFVALPNGLKLSGKADVVIRAEIWGHANFDDHRLPSLRLNSLRGIGGLMAVQKVEQISQNWFYQHRAQHPADKIDPIWPMLLFGGWTYTDEPLQGIYYALFFNLRNEKFQDLALRQKMEKVLLLHTQRYVKYYG
ncbi:hypothetical protein HGB07_07835 [Candidatus Roizmanbacteria bacterium]|nr:hypothetical protein [Candidatus Roizmanbacteria bacterium]